MSRKDGKSEDLKSMLMSFRIAELQTLLTSCGRSRSGRKHELLGRAVSLLKTSEGSGLRERVRARILELYHQRYPVHGGAASPTGGGSSSGVCSSYSQPYMQYSNGKDEEPTYLNRPNYKHVPSHRINSYSNQLPPTMQESRTQPLYEPHSLHPAGAMPIHPDVRFISLPFYDTVDVLIKPTSLVQKTIAGFQDMNLVCHLTPYQTQLITNSRSFNIKSVIEYAVQVQLRFCLAETSCVQEDIYPPRCKVIVNGKGCTLPGQPPPSAQNQEPRKPHRPINITSFCRLSPMQSNQIQIQWIPSDLGQRYAATVHLVKVVQTQTLISALRNKPERSSDHTISFIKEKLHQDPDSEIALTSLKVSLCCPIGRTRMTMPCRANNCNHLQCFDGSLYIQMNERKPSWVCPVCDQKAHYEQLFKDGMFANIIKKSTDCDDIVFFQDGSWRPLSDIPDNKPISQLLSMPQPEKKKPLAVVDCQTPPLLTLNSTPVNTLASSSSSPPPMPHLEPIPRTTTQTEKTSEDEDVEVIMIDDSDSEDEITNMLPPTMSTDSRVNSRYEHTDPHGASSLPFSDPELQGLDLYNLLPHEDRIAAAMYLDQAGILGQLTNPSSRTSPSSIIDISDE